MVDPAPKWSYTLVESAKKELILSQEKEDISAVPSPQVQSGGELEFTSFSLNACNFIAFLFTVFFIGLNEN